MSAYTILASLGGRKAPSLKDNLLKFEKPVDPQEQALRNAAAMLALFGLAGKADSLGKLRDDMLDMTKLDSQP